MDTRRPISSLIFDMDGTLLDTREVVPEAYARTVLALGGPAYTREQIIGVYAVGPPEAILHELLRHPNSSGNLELYYKNLRTLSPLVKLYPDTEDVLSALARRIPLAVFTGARVAACTILLESSGILPYFRVLVGGDEVSNPKPHPDGLVLACQRLGVQPTTAAYVGDSPLDIEAARRSQTVAIAAAWGHQFDPGIAADITVRSPRELLGLVGWASCDRSCRP